MIVSYNWLQKYFNKQLPKAKEIAEVLTLRAFEVESVEKVGDDFVLDIDVLPNRASDCLSHRFIAREIATLFNLDFKNKTIEKRDFKNGSDVIVQNNNGGICKRYIGKRVENIKVSASPKWLSDNLVTIGQKSINNIVDATNYVMFDTGQPLHAFDADKVDGDIVIRNAKNGEKITTLDGKDLELDESILVIADSVSVLAIAGIKGGKKAEVDENTKNIILEAANFDSVSIRAASRKLRVITDSSKRFENGVSPSMPSIAMAEVSSLITEIASTENTKIGESTDIYARVRNPYKVGVSVDEISSLLGIDISFEIVEDVFRRLGFDFEYIKPIEKIKEIINSGKILGKKYKSGSSVSYDAPNMFDCSSLSGWIFTEAGIAIHRISVDQFVFCEDIDKKDLSFGDLVFSNTGLTIKTGIHYKSIEFLPGTEVKSGVDHLGIYIGDGKILHTSSKTEKVVVEDLDKSEMFKNIVGYKRVPGVYECRFVVTVPIERSDLRIKEDLIEEVARVYGYENIKPESLHAGSHSQVNKMFYYANKVRNILIREGFSEVYTYVFTDNGDVEVENPISVGKEFLRGSLSAGVIESIRLGVHYVDLLGGGDIKVFEMGKVFSKNSENMSLCIALDTGKSKNDKDLTLDIFRILHDELGVEIKTQIEKKNIIEINFDELVKELPSVDSYEDSLDVYDSGVVFKNISAYPFVSRDIALFVHPQANEEDIVKIIKENSGPLLVTEPRLFDKFERKNKETGEIEKVSYAFKLVFQSEEKTLTDEEVNVVMEKVTEELNNVNDWQVR